jgi:non-ribosomal peptide synthetase component F
LPDKDAGNIDVVQYATQFQQQYLNAVQRDFYPFSDIVKRYSIHPDIMFVFQDVAGATNLREDEKVPTDEYEQIDLTLDTAKVPLKLSVITHAGGKKTFELNYDAALYNEADMQQLLDMVIAASLSLCEAKTLSDVSMLPESQREQVESFRQTAQADVPLKLHHQPIEKNAIDIPDTVALIAKDCTLTFKQFNEEATHLENEKLQKLIQKWRKEVLVEIRMTE